MNNLFLMLFSFLFAYFFLDILLGLFPENISLYENATWLKEDFYRYSDNKKIGWELNPNIGDINSDGQRDFIYPVKKSNKTRVAVLGDSITQGVSVHMNETFENIMERDLQSYNIESINFGVIGYTVFQYEEVLKTKVLKYKPDIVLISFYINDFIYTPINFNKDGNNLLVVNYFPGTLLDTPLNWFLYKHSKIYRLLYRRIVETIVFRNYKNEGPYNYLLLNFREKGYKSISQINNIANTNNITLLFIVFPTITDKENYEFICIHEELKNYLVKSNISYIDVLEIYSLNNHTSFLNVDDIHPNRLGHKIIGEEIAEYLKSNVLN